jgi:hypothetical protein
MNKITATSKTGKQIVLTNNGRGITANIPCMGLDLGPVDLIDGGVRNTFPKMIGGQRRHVEMMFDESQMAAVQDLFTVMRANVEMTSAVERGHAAHTSKISRAMNA